MGGRELRHFSILFHFIGCSKIWGNQGAHRNTELMNFWCLLLRNEKALGIGGLEVQLTEEHGPLQSQAIKAAGVLSFPFLLFLNRQSPASLKAIPLTACCCAHSLTSEQRWLPPLIPERQPFSLQSPHNTNRFDPCFVIPKLLTHPLLKGASALVVLRVSSSVVQVWVWFW